MPGSPIAIQSLQGAFRIANYVVLKSKSLKHTASEQKNRCEMELPDWFPWDESSNRSTDDTSPKHIFCNQETMDTFDNTGPQKVIEMYRNIFAQIWNVERHKKRTKGASLTKV